MKNLQPTTYNSFEPEGPQSLNGLQPNKRGFARTLSLVLSSFFLCFTLKLKNIFADAFRLFYKSYDRKTKPNLVSGFVVLFAILVSSIVLTISFGLLTIALKEVILSSAGRESQFGFYAADAGAECALYWDIKGSGGLSIFPTSTVSVPPSSGIICGNLTSGAAQDITQARLTEGNFFQAWDTSNRTASAATTTFYLSVVSGKSCAKVEVAKDANNTKIQAYGYNTCNFTDPRVIERGIRVTY